MSKDQIDDFYCHVIQLLILKIYEKYIIFYVGYIKYNFLFILTIVMLYVVYKIGLITLPMKNNVIW
jgi:hypothetical protein